MSARPGPSRRNLLIGAGVLAVAGAGVTYFEVDHMGSMPDYNASVAETRRVLAAQPDLRDFIRYATLAPNGHNTQPWRFEASARAITIRPDLTRRTPVVDPDDHHVFVSLGAAAENLCLACAARGRPGEMTFNAAGGVRSTLRSAPPTRQSQRCLTPFRSANRPARTMMGKRFRSAISGFWPKLRRRRVSISC